MVSAAAVKRQIEHDIAQTTDAIDACKAVEAKLREQLYSLHLRRQNLNAREGEG